MKINPEQPDSKAKAEAKDKFKKINLPKLPPAKPIEETNSKQSENGYGKFQDAIAAFNVSETSISEARSEQYSQQAEEYNTVLEMKKTAARVEESAKAPSNSLTWLAWQIGAAVVVMVSGSIGFTATSLLLKVPEVANCDRVYWPMASASVRLYCAELKAKSKNTESLLNAISMVEVLPVRHPLRSEINRKIESWASEILDLGEHQFQSGSLKDAIAVAQRVPENVSAYNLVEERIKSWNSIWSQAEKIDRQIQQSLIASRWDNAFSLARKLTYIDNDYWSKTRYKEILTKIKQAREESGKLDFAYAKLKSGTLDDLILAIEKANKVSSSSYAYKEARDLIDNAKKKLIVEMDRAITRKNWDKLLHVANRVPVNANLQEYVRDWNYLATAGSSAQIGTVSSITAAIETAKKIDSGQPLHSKAQDLIRYWNLEIKDVAVLARARSLARSGRTSDLRAAIVAARGVPRYNPRYQEAQREIGSWVYRIQVIEDRPTLARAYQAARGGNISSLKQAIAEASRIGRGRALYREAQGQIRKWNNSIQMQEDRPILDRAESLARNGDFNGAIATAQGISSRRALYGRARARIRAWSGEIQAQQNLQQANNIAAAGTPQALARAISLASQVPASTTLVGERNRSIDRWSEQLLNFAKDTSKTSLSSAIALARQIPPQASAYRSARAQIIVWQNQLQTEPPTTEN